MFKCLFKRAWHTFVLSMFAPLVLGLQPFCWKEHKRGCLLFFSDIRTKEQKFIECSNVCSSELDILLFFQCLHLWCLAFSLFVGKNTGVGVYSLFQTEEHKNKRFIECSNVCSSELDIPLSFQCLHLWYCVCDYILLYKNRRLFLLFL